MQKKYIISVVIVAIAFAGYMVYRYKNQESDLQSFREKTYSKMVEIAQKSPRGGLAQMGRALKKYNLEHKAYPAALLDLYPNYIPDKDFIEQIEWDYKVKGDDFHLSKSVTVNQQIMVAAIDKRMIPKITSGGVMVAAKGTGRAVPEKIEALTDDARAEMISRFKDLAEKEETFVTDVPKEEAPADPRILGVRKAEVGLGLPASIAQNYFVWKDASGNIGFGDSKYQNLNRYSFYQDDSWITVQKPPLKESGFPVPADSKTKETTETQIAARYQKQLVVWRDQAGHKGFGNLTYPTGQKISGFRNDSWIALDTRVQTDGFEDEKTDNQMSAKNSVTGLESEKYYVWQNASGSIGFGNIDLPAASSLKLLKDKQWIELEKKGQRQAKGPPLFEEEKISLAEIAKRNLGSMLVWKNDAKGTKGFGNLAYPENKSVSIYKAGNWLPVGTDSDRQAAKTFSGESFQKEASEEEMARKMSRSCLVWKDRKGHKAFGNMAYPRVNDLSYVCVNGTWQSANTKP